MMFYPLARNNWGQEETKAIERILHHGQFTQGKEVEAFEREFAEAFKLPYAVMTSSGSMANLIALAALFHKKQRPLERGDEAIVPAIAWATTYSPLQQYGMSLKIVDVQADTLNIDPSRLKSALTSRTRLVVAVSILGNPCALDRLREFCDAHGLYLLEDNCESMGAELGGRHCGTFGDLGTFSTFFSHQISTMEGGLVVTADRELFHLARCLRGHGWTRNVPADSPIYEKKEEDAFEEYRFLLPGYNARPLEFQGAAGREQLKKLPGFLERRRKNAALFRELFASDRRFLVQEQNGLSSWFAFTLILSPEVDLPRRRVTEALTAAEIEYRIITGGCFVRHDASRYYNYSLEGELTCANLAHDRGFFVGNHPVDLTPQLLRLREVLDRTVR